MVRVLLVSALPAVRAGLRTLLQDLGVKIVGEARSLDETPPAGEDVVVLDTPPGMDAAEIAALQDGDALSLAGGLVVLGPVGGDERLAAYLAGRPWAYLPREAEGAALAAAVQAVSAGLVVVDAALAERLMASAGDPLDPADQDGSSRTTGAALAAPSVDALTGREREVLQLIALGLSNKLIARRLAISDHTVKFHVAAILAKLGAASRTEAVHLGTRRGLVSV